MAVATAHPPPAATLDFREVFYLFRNNVGKLLLCVLLAVGGTALYLQHTRPVYASTALLEVSQPDRQNAVSDIDSSDTLKTIELKLASRSVLLGVIKTHHLEADFAAAPEETPRDYVTRAVTWIDEKVQQLREDRAAAKTPDRAPAGENVSTDSELVRAFASRVSVKLVRGSRMISLTVEDHDPAKAQKLTQAIIDEFFQQSRQSSKRDRIASRELLLAEAKRVGDQLKDAEEKLEAYRKKFNAVSLQDRQNIVVERLRDLNQQVAAAKNVRLKWEAESEQVQRAMKNAPDELLNIRAVAELPEIIELRKQVALYEARLATLAQRYGPLHPTMLQAKSEAEDLRGSVRNALQKAGARIVQSFESSKATEDALQQALGEQEKAALELDRIAIPYHTLEREVQANGTMYQKVLDTLQQHDFAHEVTANNDIAGIDIRVVEPPLEPARAARPRQYLLFAISIATGLFAGCGLALGSRALDTSIASVDAAEGTLGVPVLASVPRSRHHRLNARPVALRFPASGQAESFRSLRTALSMLPTEEERRCIMFTSAAPGEGKSYCALNCAAVFAQQGLKTLLIDADLRRPGLRSLFSDPNEKPELSACLRDPLLFPQAVQATAIENLFCLGDWSHHSGSAELVGRDGLRTIIKLALGAFERVVIDTAPLMAVSDTLHIAPNVPTICLVVYAGKTPRRAARRALKLLGEVAHRPATGLVLNKINSRSAGANYHYYYHNA